MRFFLLKTDWLYKYGIVILLFLMTGLAFVNHFTGYETYYRYINEVVGFSLFFCYRELYSCYFGFKEEKCNWQKSSIWGLAAFCVLNIIFMDFKENEYIELAKVVGLFTASFVVIIFFLIEEIPFVGKIKPFFGKIRSFFE